MCWFVDPVVPVDVGVGVVDINEVVDGSGVEVDLGGGLMGSTFTTK